MTSRRLSATARSSAWRKLLWFFMTFSCWHRRDRSRTLRAKRDKNQMREDVMELLARALLVLATMVFASASTAADNVRVGKAVPFAWTFTPVDVGIAT